MKAVDRTIQDYKDGRLAFDQPEVGRLVQEIENLRAKITKADYLLNQGAPTLALEELQ